MAFERFETLADLFLRYLRQGDDFLERTRYFGLATSDEDAGGDDGVEGFPTQEFFVVRALEKLLGEVCDRLGKADVVAHVGDEMEGVLEGLFAGLLGDLVRGPLKLPRHPSVTVAEGDDRLEVVGAIEERVGRSTHTRRIVAFVVGKRTPLRPRINNPVPKYLPTSTANQVTLLVVLNQRRRVFRIQGGAVYADESDVEILTELVILLRGRDLGREKSEGHGCSAVACLCSNSLIVVSRRSTKFLTGNLPGKKNQGK
jgi:hypothetical protein